MPEFLTLLPPDAAREKLLASLSPIEMDSESIEVVSSLGRVTAENIIAAHPLPEFQRTAVDGYAVRARDTFGATDSLPTYLHLIGEVPMGQEPGFSIQAGRCALIHTGGMLPGGADAVIMLEHTQLIQPSEGATPSEVEIFRSVADGENLIRIGEDVAANQVVIPKGTEIRPAEIGGLMALGIGSVPVVRRPRVALISTGDEIIAPSETPRPGQVRDINSYTLGALVEKFGGVAVRYGIIADNFQLLKEAAESALSKCEVVIITAGSSASTRDMTAEVIDTLGEPGVLVHGINTRPGKPTILGVCRGRAVIGLPGNPVSALVNGYLFVVPVLKKILGLAPKPNTLVRVKLTVNLPSQAGREDWLPVKITRSGPDSQNLAEPIFWKSNLIFTLTSADGLLRIPPDATGFPAGEMVEVMLI